MNPTFGKDPGRIVAVARVLGVLQGPENPPEERLRTFLGLARRELRTIAVFPYTLSTAAVGLRVGPLFVSTTFTASIPLYDPRKRSPAQWADLDSTAHTRYTWAEEVNRNLMWWAYRYLTAQKAEAFTEKLKRRKRRHGLPSVKTLAQCGPFVLVEYEGPGRPDDLLPQWAEVRGFSQKPTREDLGLQTTRRREQ